VRRTAPLLIQILDDPALLQPSDQMPLNGVCHRLKAIMSSEFDVVEKRQERSSHCQLQPILEDKLLNTSSLKLVEAAGVEPDISIENAQLTDSVNARIGKISRIAKSTVRSLYSLFTELPELPKLYLQTCPTLVNEHSEVPS
jgi:hypothetical protein